ncbi:cytochrome C biogenesis protein DsbF [Actinotalea ferrariae CF5-4]|uniref:Cytochrome C biogenesis protein DsbF n=1 Tax=Actinotalea ferrariae CF5-4 TaxID=948458 RepID=A0A021VTG1_9CELL|nr:cytochrome c maturation protein CcmE [Actinotalea ferrariae]EYR64494.1 cytochrome C biogenesis protein DsbF [Actinotalea ferrariae CF5-4]
MRARAFVVPGVGLAAVLAGTLTFGNLNDNLVYYLTPEEAISRHTAASDGERFRLGGLVQAGSVEPTAEGVEFIVVGESGAGGVKVVHSGAPNQLFQEGIGVVVEGEWQQDVFVSDTMIVKHDEEYRAPETEAEVDAP